MTTQPCFLTPRRAVRTTSFALALALLGGFARAQTPADQRAPMVDTPTIIQTLPGGRLQTRRLLSPEQIQDAIAAQVLSQDTAHRAPDLPGSRAAVTLRSGDASRRPNASTAQAITASDGTVGVVGGQTLPVSVTVTGLPYNWFSPYQTVSVSVTSGDTSAIPSTTQACVSAFGVVNSVVSVPTRILGTARWVGLTVTCGGQSQMLWAFVRPNAADNTAWQTGIRDQGGRGTCTYFAATAAVEASYKRYGKTLDLSEENLTWLRNDTNMATGDAHGPWPSQTDARYFESLPGSQGGGSGVHNLDLMSRYGICPETDCPYIGDSSYEDYAHNPIYAAAGLSGYHWSVDTPIQRAINAWNFAPAQFSPAARQDAVYGAGGYVTLSSAQMADPNYVEQVLAKGYDVVVGLTLDNDRGTSQIPVWKPTGGVDGGHAVLLVGYDHARHFFVVKNSWGYNTINAASLAPGWTDVARYSGFTLFDESYLSNVYEAGYATYPAATNTAFHGVQQAMGRWQLMFFRRSTGQYVGGGTLTVRHLPSTAGAGGSVDRLGDYVDDTTGKDYRVNGTIGTPTAAGSYPLSLFINFATPGVTPGDASGYQFYGRLGASVGAAYPAVFGSGVTSNRTVLGISMDRFCFVDGVPLTDLTFSAYHD